MEAAGLNEDGKQRKIVVTGCLAQRYNSQLAEDLPEADLVRVLEGNMAVKFRGLRSGGRALRAHACLCVVPIGL